MGIIKFRMGSGDLRNNHCRSKDKNLAQRWGDEKKIERQGINEPKHDKSVVRCNFKMMFSETTVCFHTALISWCYCDFNRRKIMM